MIVNMRERPLSSETVAAIGSACYVNGEEVRSVWFVDTEAGIVKTYDVYGDGEIRLAARTRKADLPPGVDDVGGVMSKTVSGTVELRRGAHGS